MFYQCTILNFKANYVSYLPEEINESLNVSWQDHGERGHRVEQQRRGRG